MRLQLRERAGENCHVTDQLFFDKDASCAVKKLLVLDIFAKSELREA